MALDGIYNSFIMSNEGRFNKAVIEYWDKEKGDKNE
jgi:hypothetical protein